MREENVFLLVLWLLLIPFAVGNIAAAGIGKYKKNVVFYWVTGQILLWALFQLVCVPFVLAKARMTYVVLVYCVLVLGLLFYSGLLWFREARKKRSVFSIQGSENKPDLKLYALWGLFFLLLAFQLVQAVRMTYGDGDDAFYVAVASVAEKSDHMYMILPYTGGYTGLDARHGLAPFPIWIAFLSRLSGIPVVTVAHVAVPLAMIPMTYGIFYLIGLRLCGKGKGKLPLFLSFTALLVLFGDTSIYTAENFLIARSRQGKAALGNAILPMLLFLFLLLLDRLQEQKKIEKPLWLLLVSTVTAGCLCSTQGTELTCLLIGIMGICMAVCYRKWKILIPMAACCIPAVCYAILYFLLP